MSRIKIDHTFSDAAVEAIMRARLARYDVEFDAVAPDLFVVVIVKRDRIFRIPGKTKRAAMLAAMEFEQ